MTSKQISYVKHLSKGHYGHLLDIAYDGSIAPDTPEGRIARMILSVTEGDTRYADRIKNSTVTQMIEMLKSLPEPVQS